MEFLVELPPLPAVRVPVREPFPPPTEPFLRHNRHNSQRRAIPPLEALCGFDQPDALTPGVYGGATYGYFPPGFCLPNEYTRFVRVYARDEEAGSRVCMRQSAALTRLLADMDMQAGGPESRPWDIPCARLVGSFVRHQPARAGIRGPTAPGIRVQV